MSSERDDEYFDIRKDKLETLREKGINPYPRNFDRTHSTDEAKQCFDPDRESQKEVRVAGRITAERLHGNAAFLDIKDESGTLQIYLSPDYLEQSSRFEEFENCWDIGDFIGVGGPLFKTNEGEISVVAKEASILSKGLRPLPEKFHGLQDKELRYRKRYLDLISNDDVRDIFERRSRFQTELRRQLQDRGYMEVETPMMQEIPGGADAEPFVTYHNALDRDLYLRIAPELYLKRLLIGGFEKIFEINRNFRNEGISTRHNPEFTMLELYCAYADYTDVMSLTESVLSDSIMQITGGSQVEYQDYTVDLSTPWRKVELVDLVNEETGLGVKIDQETSEILSRARDMDMDVEPKDDPGEQILEVFEEEVEDEIIQPTFVTNFPSSVSPLAKDDPDNEGTSERFELFVGGLEVGNAYSELNDPLTQRRNFEEQLKDDETIDEAFLEALEYGMPPAGGLGLGIDRLVMLITNSSSIREVVLFPTLRNPRNQ